MSEHNSPVNIQGEIEFEFHEDDGGHGEFLASRNVLTEVRSLLAQANIERAAQLFAACAENVGDELIADETTSGDVSRLRALAQMFYVAKDFGRAGHCFERLGQPAAAAQSYEAAGQLTRAAACYRSANEAARAASLYVRAGLHAEAGELFFQMREYDRAATAFARAGQHARAGQLYVQLRRWDRAVETLQKTDPSSPDFPHAVLLLGQILEHTNNHEMAMQRYLDVVRSRPLDRSTVEVHLRLARLCAARNVFAPCKSLLEELLRFDPEHDGALRLADSLPPQWRPARTTLDLPVVVAPMETGEEVAIVIDESIGERSESRLVGVDHDFECLRQSPLFARLALDELKQLYSSCEKVACRPGQALIEQGRPGEALYVIIRGTVAVTSIGADGTHTHLGELGSGAHVGEMSLLDDAPTSANIVARDGVLAFCLPRERFRALLEADDQIKLRIYDVLIGSLTARLREANTKLAAAGR